MQRDDMCAVEPAKLLPFGMTSVRALTKEHFHLNEYTGMRQQNAVSETDQVNTQHHNQSKLKILPFRPCVTHTEHVPLHDKIVLYAGDCSASRTDTIREMGTSYLHAVAVCAVNKLRIVRRTDFFSSSFVTIVGSLLMNGPFHMKSIAHDTEKAHISKSTTTTNSTRNQQKKKNDFDHYPLLDALVSDVVLFCFRLRVDMGSYIAVVIE